MAKAINYKTYFLVGVTAGTDNVGSIIERWDVTPTGPQVQAALDKATKSFDTFALVSPVGEPYPGNFVAAEYYGECG